MCKDCEDAVKLLYEKERMKSDEYEDDKITFEQYFEAFEEALKIANVTRDRCQDEVDVS